MRELLAPHRRWPRSCPGPGIYLPEEETLAVGRGERLKAHEEEGPELCLMTDAGPGFGAGDPKACAKPAGHLGRHSWE